jgi:hypothetical protein
MPPIAVTIIVVTLIPVTPVAPITIVLAAVRHHITAAQSDCQQTQNQYQFFHDASLNEVVEPEPRHRRFYPTCLAIRSISTPAVVTIIVVTVVATAVVITVVIVAAAVITATVVGSIASIIPASVMADSMPLLVARDVFVPIPVVPHKVDALIAGVVFTAMSAPILRMAWRHMQIDGWAVHCRPIHDARLLIDQLRPRKVADVDMAVETGLTDVDRDTDIGSMNRYRESERSHK